MAWPTYEVTKLIDAMVVAEGGEQAFIRAVQCSMPEVKTYARAREIALNTIAHMAWDISMKELVAIEPPLARFVRELGARWAPRGVANDPTDLNANWVPNVLAALRKSGVLKS